MVGRLRRNRFREILGINRRNLEYVFPRNARALFTRVDDKIVAKKILEEANLPTPRSLAVVSERGAIRQCVSELEQHAVAVVKPSQGFGGRGVKVVRRSETPSEDLVFHMAAILSGMFSLDQLRDRVLVEEYVHESETLREIHGNSGVSDIRVIVCDGSPAMAMLRLPCRESNETANLHAGGIGVGIDLATGETTHGVCRGKPIMRHPDTGRSLVGQNIDSWPAMLAMSREVNRLFGLGYLGIDFVVDRERGAAILEVNARPGLAIQIANRRGLLRALTDPRDLVGL